MAMVLTEEQIQLQDAARKFIQQKSPVSALRKLRDEQDDSGFDRTLWAGMAEMGWTGVLVDEAFGGLGLTPSWMGLISEECGRTLAPTPLLSTAILASTLVQALGTTEQKQNLLGKISIGQLLIALAIDETAHHCPNKINTEAKPDGEHFILNGKKIFVLDGHVADKIIVVARTSGEHDETHGISLFLLDAKTEGISIKRSHMVDYHNAAEIHFNNVQVNKNNLLGDINNAFPVLENTLDIANACIAAELLASVQESFERVVTYLKTRTQFDVLIGSFQALQHRAADMFSEIELCKSVVKKALSALDENEENRGRYVSMAKALVNDTAQLVTNESIQMFGGIGMTDEEEIGFFLKRARVLMQTFGDASYHKKRYADLSGF